MRDVLFPAGYVEVKTPLIFNKALWETSGHWSHYRQNMFLIDRPMARGDNVVEEMGVKAMNCPGHMLVFAQRGAQLPRSAAPLARADAAPPQRGVGRAVGPHARPAVFAGRRALLRHAGADWRRSASGCSGSCSVSTRDFGLSYTAKLVDAARRSSWARLRRGTHAEAAAQGGARARGTGVRAQRGRRRVLRPEDRLRRHRRDRPEMAVRHDPARLPACRSGST